MNKQQIEIECADIIDDLNIGMYFTALKKLEQLINNMTIGDINENEHVCYNDEE